MTDQEEKRFSARESVLFNPQISAGAYRLYMALDSMAGFKGQCWPNQVVLAKRLGATDRAMRRWLLELSAIVTVCRRPGVSVYILKWVETARKPIAFDRTKMSDLGQEDRTLASDQIGQKRPISTLSSEPGNRIRQQARELIEQYPYAKHLSGSPDDGLVQRCLDLAGGLDGLCGALHLMFRANRRPDLSWGWFPVAMQSYVRRRA